MIRYALVCGQEHPFEAWFGSSDDYDDQVRRGLVECPYCAATTIRKQIMSPAVTGTKAQRGPPAPAAGETLAAMTPADGDMAQVQQVMMEALHRVRQYVETHFEDVGSRFADEARDIHNGLADDRVIFGQATTEEVRELLEEGVPVAPLPLTARPPERLN